MRLARRRHPDLFEPRRSLPPIPVDRAAAIAELLQALLTEAASNAIPNPSRPTQPWPEAKPPGASRKEDADEQDRR